MFRSPKHQWRNRSAIRRAMQLARAIVDSLGSRNATPALTIGRLKRLETRQVLSVTAGFTGGVLSIQIDSGGVEAAGLFASGNDFFVDQNNNQAQDVGEVSGLIAEIGRLQATSPDQEGSFHWRGDFSRASLNQPGSNGNVIDIAGFQQTLLQASFHAIGNLNIEGAGLVSINGQAVVDGSANIISQASSIRIADNITDLVDISGATNLVANNADIMVGPAGTVHLGGVSASANRIEITEHSDLQLDNIEAQQATLISFGSMTNSDGASLRVHGDATFDAESITLADHSQDSLLIDGRVDLIARTGDISIRSEGQVQLGDLNASARNLLISEDADLLINSIDAAGNLTLESSGAIADGVNASTAVDGLSNFTGTSISLADNAGDTLQLRGPVSLVATAGDVVLSAPGSVSLGVVSATGHNIVIVEDGDLALNHIAATQDILLETSGTLTDVAGADTEAAGLARMQAISIVLADQSTEALRIAGTIELTATRGDVQLGSAGFVAVGAITASGKNLELSEDADTTISSLQATSGLFLDSSGSVTDLPGSQVRIAGTADILANSITLCDEASDNWFIGGSFTLQATTGDIELGPAGTLDIGVISAKADNIRIQEDADTEIVNVDAMGDFTVHSAGTVGDPFASRIHVRGNSVITGTSITLADNDTDQLLVDGSNSWQATDGDLTIGPAGQVELGDVSASANKLSISEDADMSLVLIQAIDRLELSSPGAITDRPGANLHAGGAASLTATSITLADHNTDRLDIEGDVTVRALTGDVRIGPSGLVTLGTLDIVGDNVFISEDAGLDVRLLDASGDAELESSGSLRDTTAAQIRVLGSALFRAQDITLADSPDDILIVAMATTFLAENDVHIGPDGLVTLGDITASARNLSLAEDTDTSLDQLQLRGDLTLVSSGSVSDIVGAHINIEGQAHIEGVALTLADHDSDRLHIASLVDLRIAGDIIIAAPGQVTLGTISAIASNISIFEDAATLLNNVISGNVLRLDSSQSIVNLVAADPARAIGVQAPLAVLTAGTFVHLGGVRFQTLTGEFHANGMLGSAAHLSLNQRADEVGVAALDLLSEPTASGEPIAPTWIDGSNLAEVQRRFSYEASFAGQYAWYVSNQTDLQVGPVRGVGDGLHLYVETLGTHDLTANSAIQIVNTSNANGAMALIAGDQLTIASNGSLETIAVTGQPGDNQRVLVPLFQADAFDGGVGPAGFESTHSVILERALAEDSRYDSVLAGAQNVFQHVSSQFGASGEAGFLAIIRYADGQTQLFDTYQEVFGSFDGGSGTKGPVGTFTGAIPAHSNSDGAAALFARSTPFGDVFLNGVQELPTSVIYRRSTDFFLFENGGSTDAALQVTNLDSGSDRVLDVLTNAVPPSFSLPTLIETTTPLVPAPILQVVENHASPGDSDQELETKVEFDTTRQIIIYRVGFDDQNENGQPEDAELPNREQIVQQHRTTQADMLDKEQDEDQTPGEQGAVVRLAPGQLDSKWRDVQKDLNPTPETLDTWIDLYRHHPHVGSGAYTIVEEASRTGIEVLRVFSVRDFEEPAPVSTEPMLQEVPIQNEAESVGSRSDQGSQSSLRAVEKVARDD